VKSFLSRGLLIGFLSAGSILWGQNASTSLHGVVKDPTGAVLPGVKVTLTNVQKGSTTEATTNATGLYNFAQIPPAHYKITVTASGFAEQSKSAELLVNQPATIDFTESVEANTVTIDVSAQAQTINTTDATVGNSVANEVIVSLPLDGRDPAALLSLQPGVLFIGQKPADAGSDGRQGSVSGARSDQSSISLDGIEDNDEMHGYAFQGILRSTVDSTEEFRVTTSNANADAGRSSGAQISLVTKSGTNQLHGSLYEYNRPSNTVANDWFLKQTQLKTGVENRPVKYIQNVFGGSGSGPALRDKLFFFFNYEGQRIATNSAETRTVPTASFMAGELKYTDANGAIQTLSSAQIAELDATCTACTTPGVNKAMLDYYSGVPVATGTAEGDKLNSGSYLFSSPKPSTLNTSILKLDYDLNSANRFFVRGNLQKDTASGVEQFPGLPAEDETIDNSKGFVLGHTWTARANLVNDLRYGFTRQGYSDRGIGKGEYVYVRFLNQPTSQTRTTIRHVPVNTITDAMTLAKGNHSIAIGGSWHRIDFQTQTDANSYNGASTNPSWLKGKAPSPTTLKQAMPDVATGFSTNYLRAYATIIGTVPELDQNLNYKVASTTSANIMAEGAMVSREFVTNNFEYYLQDTWHINQKLTVNFGFHHSLAQTPYETHGQQIAPTVDTHDWFAKRGSYAAEGKVYEPDLIFSPNGKENGKPGYWPKQKLNIAPRLSAAYELTPKTSVRAGAGLYYDHFGEGLAQRFSDNGAFGLSATLQSASSYYTYAASPRFAGGSTMPNIPVTTPDKTVTYPYTYPEDSLAIEWGVDSHMKTPYSASFNLSVQRELPAGFTLEGTYIGRLGRNLMQTLDMAEPVDFVDPQGGGDYYTAAARLAKIVDDNQGNDATVEAIPYFEHVFPQMKEYDSAGESATQAIYNNEFAYNRTSWGLIQALYDLDAGCYYGCPDGTRFWQNQFASLYAKSSIGRSSYHAGQVVLRHPSSHGLSLDFSYTFSKSLDWGSDVERAGYGYGAIQNSFKPWLNKGVSDFDTKHLITGDWVYALPVGHGRQFAANSSRLVDTFIGGWQWSGLYRWTSGLPFSLNEGGWTTNWNVQSWAVTTGKVKLHKHLDTGGVPQVFADPDAILNGVASGSPVRIAYPGEAGQRNNFRADGFFDIDTSLTKSFNLQKAGKIRFAWDVFNVTNLVRFDAYSLTTTITEAALGNYDTELGGQSPFRRMQFSMRWEF